jgi:hypothetical protein
MQRRIWPRRLGKRTSFSFKIRFFWKLNAGSTWSRNLESLSPLLLLQCSRSKILASRGPGAILSEGLGLGTGRNVGAKANEIVWSPCNGNGRGHRLDRPMPTVRVARMASRSPSRTIRQTRTKGGRHRAPRASAPLSFLPATRRLVGAADRPGVPATAHPHIGVHERWGGLHMPLWAIRSHRRMVLPER